MRRGSTWSVEPTRTGTAATYPAKNKALIEPASVFDSRHNASKSGNNAAKLELPSMPSTDVALRMVISARGEGPSAGSAVSDMDGMAIDRERRFLDRFLERGVSMNGTRDVLGGRGEFHGQRSLGDHRAGVRADDMDAEDAIAAGIGENFDKAFGESVGASARIGRERELAGLVGDARLLQLFLRSADRGHL